MQSTGGEMILPFADADKSNRLLEVISTCGPSAETVEASAERHDGIVTLTAQSPHLNVTVPPDFLCFDLQTLLTLTARSPAAPDWARRRRRGRRRQGRSRPADERCLGTE